MKITFKKEPRETGLSSIAYPERSTDIKVDGLVVGSINAPHAFTQGNDWYIRLAIQQEPTDETPRKFKWVTLKARFASEPEAREALKGGLLDRALTSNNLTLHQFPKDEY